MFFTIAAVALAWSIAAGQWHDLAGAASIVLAIDDPYPGDSDSPPTPRQERDVMPQSQQLAATLWALGVGILFTS